MNKTMETKIKNAIIRQQVSSRGGGIEIDLTHFGYSFGKMTAYQNYLGGGMLGGIANDCNINQHFGCKHINWKKDKKLIGIAEELSKYLHKLTNPDCEWSGSSYEDNQKRSVSAY